jgi:hypothetical protein
VTATVAFGAASSVDAFAVRDAVLRMWTLTSALARAAARTDERPPDGARVLQVGLIRWDETLASTSNWP